jgi:benzoate-CoA ligase family protein
MSFRPPERFNIADYFLDQRVAEGRGNRIALRLDDRQMTYDEVLALANRFGQVLLRIGVRPEERVLIALPDGPEFVGALFGVLKSGAVVVMVNPGLEPEALAGLFDYSQARVAVVNADVLPRFEEAIEIAAWKPGLLAVGDGEHPHLRFEEEQQKVGAGLETAPTHRDDPAIWLFSGGTTGRPKAVVQTHTSFANTTECYAKTALGYSEDDITLSVPKLFFGYATGSNLFFPFSVGASAVLYPEHPTVEVVFEKIRRHRPTILVNVPTMINRMVQHPDASSQDLSSLRFATSAGEALPAPLHRSWRETFGVELLDGLGTAEMWHIFISNLPDEVRPGTLGRPVPGFDVEIRDTDGKSLPDGEVGRLWVRGNSLAIGYWQNTSQTAEAFQGEWFVGGDLVRRDEDGYITYCGRADDVLKVGGKWLVPQEVESCLMKHPAVDECAVIGVETTDGLTKPWAFVIAKESSPDLEQTLKQFVLDQLQPYKHPRRVVVVESFPRTHLGKIDRGKLKRTARDK